MIKVAYKTRFNIWICIFLLSIIVFFTFQMISAEQSEVITWERTYGGIDGDGAKALIQTTDGGYVVAGYTYSKGAGSADFWLLKLNKQGNLLWDKTFGGSKSDEPSCLIQTNDGGYAIAGTTSSKGPGILVIGGNTVVSRNVGVRELWVIKLDKQGKRVWDWVYGGRDRDGASSIIQTSDGSYVIAGYYEFYGKRGYDLDFWLLKLDGRGMSIWDRTFGEKEKEISSSLIQTTDGGYVVAGCTYSYGAGGSDLWLLKLDSQGNILWNRTYGGSSGDYTSSLIQTTDGGYAVAGHTKSKGDGNTNMWILKLDEQGNLEKIEKEGQEPEKKSSSREPVMKASTKDKTVDLTLVVITSPTFLFNLAKHDLTVKIDGPTYDWETFDDVRGAKPVTINFYDIPQGHYKVTAKYGSKTISKEIDIYGVTFDFEMTF